MLLSYAKPYLQHESSIAFNPKDYLGSNLIMHSLFSVQMPRMIVTKCDVPISFQKTEFD